jgi:hypothetical protein
MINHKTWSDFCHILHVHRVGFPDFGDWADNADARVAIIDAVEKTYKENLGFNFQGVRQYLELNYPGKFCVEAILGDIFNAELGNNPSSPTPQPETPILELTPSPPAKPHVMKLCDILDKANDSNELDLDEIEFLNNLNWELVEDVNDSHYGVEWFTCEGLDLTMPIANEANVLEPYGRAYTYSTLWCEDHATWIDDASAWGLDKDQGHLWDWWDSTAYSDEWLSENTFICSDCGDRFHIDDCCSTDWDSYCSNCYPGDEGEDSEYIQSYHSNVFNTHGRKAFYNGTWGGLGTTARIYGVELETEAKNSRSELAEELEGFRRERFIMKDDGSLSNGLEIVTLPFDLAGHKTKFGWSDILETARDYAESRSTCGIHIHVNRASLSVLTATKLTAFLVNPKHEHFNQTIAQRKYYGHTYCGVTESTETSVVKLKKAQGTNRHIAVNQNNAETIEIRIFAANLRPERVLKNLEFVDSLILYCRDASAANISIPGFIAFLAANRKTYRNLWNFMIEKQLIDLKDYPKSGTHIPLQLAA